MASNDIRRQIRKCETNESAQLTRLRESTRAGRSQVSIVHAENVIRHRYELVRLESILEKLVGLSGRLKQVLMTNPDAVSDGNRPTANARILADRQQAESVLQEAKSPAVVSGPVPRTEVDNLISQLSETTDDCLASIASMQQDELMNRLRSLRK